MRGMESAMRRVRLPKMPMIARSTGLALALLALGACEEMMQARDAWKTWEGFEDSWSPPPADTPAQALFPLAVIADARAFRLQLKSHASEDMRGIDARARYARYSVDDEIVTVRIARMDEATRDRFYTKTTDALSDSGSYSSLGGSGYRYLRIEKNKQIEIMWWGRGWLYRAKASAGLPLDEFLRELMRSDLEPVVPTLKKRATKKPAAKVTVRPVQNAASPSPPDTGWIRQATYVGNCKKRPTGSTCLVFPDGYKWLIWNGVLQRGSDGPLHEGKKTYVVLSGPNELHHVLGTDLVRTVSRK
jgi:hypothetical protein